ncbi:hypothetical protein ABIF90_007214 [Bradyrhizobium japonicum]
MLLNNRKTLLIKQIDIENEIRGVLRASRLTLSGQISQVTCEQTNEVTDGDPRPAAMLRPMLVAGGDVLGTARIAGIMAAKRTLELTPLCHPLALSKITVTSSRRQAAGLPRARRPRCANSTAYYTKWYLKYYAANRHVSGS